MACSELIKNFDESVIKCGDFMSADSKAVTNILAAFSFTAKGGGL